MEAQLPTAANGKFRKVEGVNLYYEESGKGPTLLLLHGFGETLETWKPYLADLAKFNRVIAVDLPGHGRSSMLDSSNIYLHKQAANVLLSFLDALKLDTVNVMGFSSGAFITLYLATLKPALTRKIIVVAGQTYYSDSTRRFIRSLGGANNFIMDQKELETLHGSRKGKVIAEQFWNFRQLYGDPSFTPDVLSTIQANTLIIHGDDDPVAPIENAFQLYRNIPKSHLYIIPNAGHVGFFQPKNQKEFLQRVTDFLVGK